jgi:hypothetical protein
MHATVPPEQQASPDAQPVWRLEWLTPVRCRMVLAGVLLLGFVGHLIYLTNDCPIDLSGDEAHYWDWSRRLDLSYYSKGPLVAYLIRASCTVCGDTMWAVRLPALVLATGTALVTYLLARKLFDSDRIALGAVLLTALVPMFIAGSLLMTIDPPFVFCWAAATYLLAKAMFDGSRWWHWPAIGVAVGVGFLAKYAMFLWLPTMLLAMWVDRPSPRNLRKAGPWVVVGVALLFTIPVVVWNARQGWVSVRHVARQTGTDGPKRFAPLSPVEFVGGQVGVLGPPVAVLMGAAAVYGWMRVRRGTGARRREMAFLLAVGLPFLAVTTLTSFRTKVQPNWPAPAYFTLLVLTAYFVATRSRDPAAWKPWRPWVYAAVVLGVIAIPVLHHSELLYPLLRWPHGRRDDGELPSVRRLDATARLKGWAEQGGIISRELAQLRTGAFVLCDDYQETALMAFYVAGQPKTYCAGSYFAGERRKRHTQYDLWPDRSLDPADRPDLIGRDAVYVGFLNDDVRAAFERIDGPVQLDIVRGGVKIRTVRYARCYGFKGMTRPGGGGRF